MPKAFKSCPKSNKSANLVTLTATFQDFSNEPDLEPFIRPSVVYDIGWRKVGIIGYLTPETADLAQTGAVRFLDEADKIQEQVDQLKDQGVDILIAVGHSGYDVDLKIAQKVKGISSMMRDFTKLLPSGEAFLAEMAGQQTGLNGRETKLA